MTIGNASRPPGELLQIVGLDFMLGGRAIEGHDLAAVAAVVQQHARLAPRAPARCRSSANERRLPGVSAIQGPDEPITS